MLHKDGWLLFESMLFCAFRAVVSVGSIDLSEWLRGCDPSGGGCKVCCMLIAKFLCYCVCIFRNKLYHIIQIYIQIIFVRGQFLVAFFSVSRLLLLMLACIALTYIISRFLSYSTSSRLSG